MKQDILLTIVLAIFASSGFWSFLQSWIAKKYSKKTAEQKLLLGIAFKEICETCQCHLKVGEIDAEEYKELNHYLFEPYAEMGGDGTAERLIKEVEKLPIKRKEI